VWFRRDRVIHRIAKPLATSLLIAGTVAYAPAEPAARWFIVGLALALGGDIALMFPGRRAFAVGLGLFALCLALYAIAFALQAPPTWRDLVYLLFPLGAALYMLQGLWHRLGRFRWFVGAYTLLVSTMLWRAFARFETSTIGIPEWFLGTVGALLFLVSDALVAKRRFLQRRAPYWIELGTYYAAQSCLCLSMTA
jgi:uncharacterized membrane protein YhhN